MNIKVGDVEVYLRKNNIEYEKKFNNFTFILKNNNMYDENEIVLFVNLKYMEIILFNNKIQRQERFSNINNILSKYIFFKKISKYYAEK